MLKAPVLLKLGTNAWYHILLLGAKDKVEIFHSPADTGPPEKMAIFPILCIINCSTLPCQCNKQKRHLEITATVGCSLLLILTVQQTI